jgi:hypothetical protein
MTAQLPVPDITDALTCGGAMCHYIASDPARAEDFARWIEHCPGDLDAELITAYLSAVHDLLAPACPWAAHTDVPRGGG